MSETSRSPHGFQSDESVADPVAKDSYRPTYTQPNDMTPSGIQSTGPVTHAQKRPAPSGQPPSSGYDYRNALPKDRPSGLVINGAPNAFRVQPQLVDSLPLAPWSARVLARLVDTVVEFGLPVFLFAIAFGDEHTSGYDAAGNQTDNYTSLGTGLLIASFVMALLTILFNRGILQGRTGQSIGKKTTSIKVVNQENARPTGVSQGLFRVFVELAIQLVTMCTGFLWLLDSLWPIWDPRKQTFHDKIARTVVVKLEPADPSHQHGSTRN